MAITAVVNASALGDNAVVAAVAGKKIRVKAWALSNGVATAQAAKWRSGTTDLTGLFYSAAVGTIAIHDFAPSMGNEFYFETVAGQALNVNLSAATVVGGTVQYTLE